MTDIKFGERAKLKMRVFAALALKELGLKDEIKKIRGVSTLDLIHDDLDSLTDPVFRKIWRVSKKAAGHIKETHQKSILYDIGGFGEWVCYKDTGYRDPFFWILNELFEDKSFREELKKFVKEPKDWYVNRWHDTKANTKKAKKKGEIAGFEMSPDEKAFVPQYQQKEWDRINKEFKEEMKRRR